MFTLLQIFPSSDVFPSNCNWVLGSKEDLIKEFPFLPSDCPAWCSLASAAWTQDYHLDMIIIIMIRYVYCLTRITLIFLLIFNSVVICKPHTKLGQQIHEERTVEILTQLVQYKPREDTKGRLLLFLGYSPVTQHAVFYVFLYFFSLGWLFKESVHPHVQKLVA